MLGGALASHSFLWLFLGDGLTSLMFAVIIWRGVPETRPSRPTPADATRAPGWLTGMLVPFRDGPFVMFLLLSMLGIVVFMQFVTALPMDMAACGVPRWAIGLVLAMNGALVVFVQPLVAPALARRDRSFVIAAGIALIGLGFGLHALAHTAMGFAVGVVLWSLGEIAVLPTSNAVVADLARPEFRGRYQGAFGLAWGSAAFLAPLIGTAVFQHAGRTVLWTACLMLATLVACGHVMLRPHLHRLRLEREAARA